MRTLRWIPVALAALVSFAPAAHAGLARPDLDLSFGTTTAVTGKPGDGGLSAAFSPMWPVSDRLRFGATVFADDMGSTLTQLHDPLTHVALGTVSELHRWVWGAGWRGDADVVRRGAWSASAIGTWSWQRIEDDVRGATNAAKSSVGFSLGGEIRRTATKAQSIGVAVRYNRMFWNHDSVYQPAQRYVTTAVEWRWSAPAAN